MSYLGYGFVVSGLRPSMWLMPLALVCLALIIMLALAMHESRALAGISGPGGPQEPFAVLAR